MMKKFKLLLVALVGILAITACKKDDDSSSQTPATTATTLNLTLLDESGSAVPGASVELYASETNLYNRSNQIGETQTSNASGKVVFNNVSDITYYWFAEKDCENNYYGINSSNSPLTQDAANEYTVGLTPTGTLKLVCSSSNPYEVFINNVKVFDMDGGTSQTLEYTPAETYVIRVLQISGYIFSPTDNTYNVVVNCGQTTTLTFP